MTTEPKRVIGVDGLTKHFGAVTALDDVSFSVNAGELFGLIGPDGAGKSTIYRILSTLTKPDSGKAKVFGLDTAGKDQCLRLRTLIGYMPQRFSLYPELTVWENLNFFASLFGVSIKENYDIIAPVFAQLAKFPNRPAGKLSGGMKQKLALSCALIHRPRLLLLDEPTTGVDAVSRSEFWDMLGTLKSKGITIVVSTSYMDEATRCDRIAMMDHGHILITDTPAHLSKNIGENLYAARATSMFKLLEAMRKLPDVTDCYTFGATIHLVGSNSFNPASALATLRSKGLHDATIVPAKGDIEDLFIKLTRNDG